MSDSEDFEDPRDRIARQLAQISAGVAVMVPRLSEEDIITHTRRSLSSSPSHSPSPCPIERRPVLRRIGPSSYELDSETDDEDEIRQPIRSTASVRTIVVTDSEEDGDDNGIQIQAHPSPPAEQFQLPRISDVFGANQSTVEPVSAKSNDSIENDQLFVPRILGQNVYPNKTVILIGNNSTASSSQINESSDDTSIPSTLTTASISKTDIRSTSPTAQESSGKTSISSIPRAVQTSKPNIHSTVLTTQESSDKMSIHSTSTAAPISETIIQSGVIIRDSTSNSSETTPSPDVPIVSCCSTSSETLSVADAISKTITSMIPPKKSKNQPLLSMPSLNPDEFIENPNEIVEPKQNSDKAIEPESSNNVEPVQNLDKAIEPESNSSSIEPERNADKAIEPESNSSEVIEPERNPIEIVEPEPVAPVQLPIKLRVKSGAMLGITDYRSLMKPTSTLENTDIKNNDALRNVSTQNQSGVAVVNSAAIKMTEQREQLPRYMDQIAILMKDQFIDSHNVIERRRILDKEMVAGQYTNLQVLEMQNLDKSYRESSDTHFTKIMILLEACIFYKSVKDVLRQIFHNFHVIMKTVRKPKVMKSSSIFAFFKEILTQAMYVNHHNNFSLLKKLPQIQFDTITEELRLEFKLDHTKTRKRIAPDYNIASQIGQNPTIPPIKVARAETTPHEFSNIVDTSIGAIRPMVSNLPMGANSSPMVQSSPVGIRNSPVAPNPSAGTRTTSTATNSLMGAGSMPMTQNPPARISSLAPNSLMGTRNTQAQNPHTYSRSISMTPNSQNIRHLRPQFQYHNPNCANTNACRNQLPVMRAGNIMVGGNMHTEMNRPTNSERFYGSNPQPVQFRPPPPYPQQSIGPEMSQNVMYHSSVSKEQELAYRRMPSQPVRPNYMNFQSPSEVNASTSLSSGSPPVNPFTAARNRIPVSAQNPFVFPAVSGRHSYTASPINSPSTTSYNHTMTAPNPAVSGRHSYTASPINSPPTTSYSPTMTPPNPFSQLTTTNTYPTYQPARAPDQGYRSMTNPAMNLTIGARVPATASNHVTTIVERPQYVSAQGDYIRNQSSQNIGFTQTQQTSFSIRNPTLPSFTSNSEDPPLSVHEVNSTLSPTAGPSPSLESCGDLPLSVDFVHSSSSPNLDQICDFEGLGPISEPFLKDSEFEEFMKSNDLNIRMEEDEFGK